MAQESLQSSAALASVFVYYEGHLTTFPHVLVGKLLLNSRYLIFHIYEPHYPGVLQSPKLNSTGRVVSIALSAIVDVAIESGVRARSSRPNWKNKDDFQRKSAGYRSINAQPGFLDDSETYSKLMLTIETGNGIEIAAFEVQDPQAWVKSLRDCVTKSAS